MPDDLAEAIKTLVAEYEKVAHAFAGTLRGYERDSFPLTAAEGYWESGSYRGQHVHPHPLIDANETGRVGAITVDETGDALPIRVRVDDAWRDVARLDIPHADFRRFLLPALLHLAMECLERS